MVEGRFWEQAKVLKVSPVVQREWYLDDILVRDALAMLMVWGARARCVVPQR
jgi:hypothetical protein